MTHTIQRGFADIGALQVHYRQIGAVDAAPLVMIHPSPGSSKQLSGLMAALAALGHKVVAPDTAGNGDSAALDMAQPEIGDLAAHALAAVDTLGLGQFDLYGSHTGASIAMEIAIAHPERVRRLVIDGMGLYPGEMQAEVLAQYAREITPDTEATHLMKVWHFCRDQYLFWPYYNRTVDGRLPNGLPSAQELHEFVVEVLKAMSTYHRSYRAAFRHPKRDRLPLIKVPTLVCASSSDMLRGYFEAVAALVPNAQTAELPPWNTDTFNPGAATILHKFLTEDTA